MSPEPCTLRTPRGLRRLRHLPGSLALAALAAWAAPIARAQTTTPSADAKDSAKDDTLVLSPFEVVGTKDRGYAATSSLAGSRLNTPLKDIASAISVVTSQFMQDTGSTNLQQILVYQTDAEVSGIGGNYYGGNADDGSYRARMLVNPQSGTRIRGLDTADLTRDYFATSIPMDAYNTSRVDIQRGPNSILFGLGSPAGIINNTLKTPGLQRTGGSVEMRVGSYGSKRAVVDADVTLLRHTLGLRVIGMDDDAKYRQDFTFNHDKRIYGALRWQPKLGEGVFTQIDAIGESGRISANRPVAVTPADFISNWFGPLNHYLMYNPLTSNGIPQDSSGAQHPELTAYFSGAPARDWWNGSPGTIWANPASGVIGSGGLDAYRQRDGEPWGGLSGVTNANWTEGGPWIKDQASYYANNPIVSKLISNYQTTTGQTFSGFGSSLWPTQMILSGPLAFTNRTLQGPNKSEWNNFDSIKLSGTQSYLNGRLGINGGYYRESYRSGYANAISTDRVTVDVNAFLRDGSANPNVGRPVLYGPSSGEQMQENREEYRSSLYYKFNIADYVGRKNLLSRLFGEQIFTGNLMGQRYEDFSRNFSLYGWDVNTYAGQFLPDHTYYDWWGIHYLGSSLMNVPTFGAIPSSAIQGVTAVQNPGTSNNTLVWDSNTKTWHTATVDIVNYQNNINHLYTGAAQGFDDTTSKSFVWQGKLLNDSIDTLFGWRSDSYRRWDKPSSLIRDQYQTPMPYSSQWNYVGTSPLTADEQRRSWGVVLHTRNLLEMLHYTMPKGLDVAFTYNESNSFRPSDVGTDVYGNKLDAPSGKTRDIGVLVTAMDNRYSFRATWYTTTQKNTTISDPSGMLYWNKAGIARTMNAMEMETWTSGTYRQQTTPEALVNKWMFGTYDTSIANQPLPADWRNNIAALLNEPLRIRRAAVPGNPEYVAQGTINPATGTPYLAPPLDDEELAYRKLWFAARTDAQWSRPLDPAWWNAMQFKQDGTTDWGIWGQNSPAGEKLTNDLVSKGVEFELTANPTNNWRMTFNASRVMAVRSNILSDWAAYVAKNKSLWFDGYNQIPVNQLNYWNITGFGQIRHWYSETTYSGAVDTLGGRMAANVYGPYMNLIASNGQAVNELRKWRFNFVTNYTFDRGFLKHVNVGGAVRWQDRAAIGYYPKYQSDAGIWVTDVNNPIYGRSEANYDAWIGYERRLTRKITWQIQLNVRDLFASSSLIPTMANPDGTIAQVRIPSPTTWSLTNTLSF
ncbi:catecholate siderophore receptor Fiu precursor [mine drainage metagenome]|uniref:Catecholate siderophore receptor Fiu n=1 Tax=mine drainage metagenome TaxID=410659 RepID=A0A1J5RT56_9ZZZZ